MSPFTITGMLTTSRALAAHDQSAAPLVPICAVRQWIVSAATPTSSRRRASSTMGICDSGPYPMRVFTVTGSATAFDDELAAIATIALGVSQPARARAAPAILGTQQPQLMSMNAGPAASATERRFGERSGLEP
jgi:hypothetical protein